ncbi:MAG: hypothetical protein ACKV19_15425 [Verrucomicrobiales bacterium]
MPPAQFIVTLAFIRGIGPSLGFEFLFPARAVGSPGDDGKAPVLQSLETDPGRRLLLIYD